MSESRAGDGDDFYQLYNVGKPDNYGGVFNWSVDAIIDRAAEKYGITKEQINKIKKIIDFVEVTDDKIIINLTNVNIKIDK